MPEHARPGIRKGKSLGSAIVPALANTSRFAMQATQVVQLGATHAATGNDLDGIDARSMDREATLDACAEAHLADDESLSQAFAGARNDDAPESLNTGVLALGDLHVHLNGVARTEFRNRLCWLEALGLEILNCAPR